MPGKLSKILLLAGAAGSVALAAVWAQRSGSVSEKSSVSRSLASPSSNAASQYNSSRYYLPEPGRRYTYSFERRIRFEGGLAGAKLPNIAYKGELYLDVLRADGRSFEAVVTEKVQGNGLSPALRFEADARGDSLSLFSRPEPEANEKEHAQVMKDLLALWFFPLRADTVGAYEARFDQAEGKNGELRDRKAKLGYLTKARNTPEILSSLHVLEWHDDLQLPKEVRGEEITRMGSAGGQLSAESRYLIRFLSSAQMPAHDPALLSSLREGTALQLGDANPDPSLHPDYAKLNWPTISAQLRALGQMNGMQQLEVFGDLLKFLRMHPEKAAEAAALLRDPALLRAAPGSPLFKTLVGALASLASPEALEALRQAYEDPALPDQARATILAALTTTQAPLDGPTRDFLAQRMQAEKNAQLARGAAYALGSALQSAGNDAQSAHAIQQIEGAWNQARAGALGDQLALLDVMGNSGRAEFYPALQAVIAGSSLTALKAKAVFALRFMDGGQPSQELVSRLADPEVELREAAARALELAAWRESFRAPLERCAGSEPVARVQELCRKTLAQNTRVAGN